MGYILNVFKSIQDWLNKSKFSVIRKIELIDYRCLSLVVSSLLMVTLFQSAIFSQSLRWWHDPFQLTLREDTSAVFDVNDHQESTTQFYQKEGLVLQAVWNIDGINKAMISDQIVVEGTQIDSWIVRDVSTTAVVLSSKEDKRLITLGVKHD